ncbi:MAG TPA: hypothetical protein VGV59_02785 [Pyrinomonadaceae bacterium]|nr:hypothetical protein [Pyrinomonadaceae bacterium]
MSVLAEVERLLNERPGNQLKTAREGTRRLQENRLINAQEAKEINEICKTIFAAQRGKGDPEAAARRVRQTYERMLDKAASSPVALAIAGLASSGPIETPAGDGASPNVVAAPAISRSNRISLGMVGGVIGGAVIGGAIGGGGGAIIGAVVGGIAGGIAAACT